MPSVSKADFLKPLARNRERFDLPELGEAAYVMVQALGAKEIRELQERFGPKATTDRDNFSFGYGVLALALCDDDGKALFADPAEVRDCMNVSYETFERLCERALQVSGIKVERSDGPNS